MTPKLHLWITHFTRSSGLFKTSSGTLFSATRSHHGLNFLEWVLFNLILKSQFCYEFNDELPIFYLFFLNFNSRLFVCLTDVQYTNDVLEAFSSFKLDCDTGSGVPKRTPVTYPDVVKDSDQDPDKTIVDSLPDVKKVGYMTVSPLFYLTGTFVRWDTSTSTLKKK